MWVLSAFAVSCLALHAHAQYTVTTFGNFSGPNGPLIDLGYTKIQGTTFVPASLGINAFLSIPFAAPPTGRNRFSAPIPVESVTKPGSTHDGSTFGAYCYNSFSSAAPPSVVIPELGLGNRQPSEDCLFLDVLTPQKPVSSSLPVMFNIHGGGYNEGGSSGSVVIPGFETSPGQYIQVNIQYRLAGFGFLAGHDVASKGSLNAGLLDQRLALLWVQRHIAAFGGDPARVTINGGSAGGGSVAYQLIWDGGEPHPPYRAGIAQFPYLQNHYTPAQQDQQYNHILASANCSDIACLRTLSGEAYNNVQQAALYSATFPYGTFYYGPVVDGVHIRDLPSKELQASHFAKVPLITTRDGNEGLVFTPQNITTQADYEARVMTLFPSAGSNFLGRLNDYLPLNLTGPFAYTSEQERAEYVFGYWTIQCPSYYLASALVDAWSVANATSQPIYKFIYALPTFQTAYHGSYDFLLEAYFPPSDTSATAQVVQTIQAYFNNFVINLDPNIPAGNTSAPVEFPEYGSSSTILLFNDTVPAEIHDIDASGTCDFFYAHPYVTYN